jgi:hypothetical protein
MGKFGVGVAAVRMREVWNFGDELKRRNEIFGGWSLVVILYRSVMCAYRYSEIVCKTQPDMRHEYQRRLSR